MPNAAPSKALIAAQDESTRAARAAAERASALACLEAEIRRLEQSVDAARGVAAGSLAALEALGDGVALTQGVAEARAATADARTASGEARAALESLKREGESRRLRLAAIAEDASRWEARRAAAANQIAELSRRHEELKTELAAAERVPEEIGGQAQRASGRDRQCRSRAAFRPPMPASRPKPCWPKPTRPPRPPTRRLPAPARNVPAQQALFGKRRRAHRGTA